MKISFTSTPSKGRTKQKHAIVLLISKTLKLSTTAASIDKKTGGALARALKAGKFEGKAGEVRSIIGVDGIHGDRVVLIGLGDEKKIDHLTLQKAGGSAAGHLGGDGVKSAELIMDTIKGVKPGEAAAHFAFGARLRRYHFLKYYTKRKDELKPTLATLSVVTKAVKDAKALFNEFNKVADGVDLTKDVVTEPANIIYPESFAKKCRELSKLGVKVEILNEAQMKKLGMHSLLGVGQGSEHDSRLAIMRWEGAAKSKKPIAFVGKGVTFDTGGISIKPSANMHDMKYDMAGGGAVLGLMKALAGRKAKANVIGVVGLVENMPSGTAIRPGDVITSMSGQTIEVLNTDAEGRLVLADALWYTQDRFKPEFIIDLATLTGAIVVSLGDTRCGAFSNNDTLAKRIAEASEKTGEMSWRFPLGEEYDKQINSQIADMQNIGEGRGAGSITAAQFLQRFVNKTPWAHLDIAGVAWSGKGDATAEKGATGFGVRLLNQLVKDHYET